MNKQLADEVNYALENKIILCTGPSQRGRERLIQVTEQDQEIIPFKKIFFSTNDMSLMDVEFHGQKPVCEFIGNQETYLDCYNCMITTIQNVINDPDCKDDDIILFKHETLYINDMYLLRKSIEKILQGHNMVIRYFYKHGYYMTDGWFFKSFSS